MSLCPSGNSDRNDNIENRVSYQVEEKKVDKGLGRFSPKFLNAQYLCPFTHSNHKTTFSVMSQKKNNATVNLVIYGPKDMEYGLHMQEYFIFVDIK